jgi:hypothetical protein
MNGLRITEEELRDTIVTRLGIADEGEFLKARNMARRFHLPLALAVSDRCRIPYHFLLEQLAEEWGVEFADLKFSAIEEVLRAAL